MISYLKGRIVAERPGFVILETQGVGYKVYTTWSSVVSYPTFAKASVGRQSSGQKSAEFYVYENIREDVDDLYGFLTFEELELFEKLISVNGVGPKAGLLIMASAGVDKIIGAITGENLAFFTAITGIGKKVAAKIILDLKSKISGLDGSGVIGQSEAHDEVIDALISLGYKQPEIIKVLPKIPVEIKDSESKIRWLLKNLIK